MMLRHRVAAWLVSATVLAISGASRGATPGVPQHMQVQAVDSLSQAVVDTGEAVGLSIAVLKRGELLFQGAYGYADLESYASTTDSTLFYIGSITKPITAAAILQLVAHKKLDIDDDITHHVPEIDDGGTTVTIRHLLNHTSGLAGPGQVAAKFVDRRHLEFSRSDIIDLLMGEPRVSEPGERFAYNNLGYLLLGIIIERVSGHSYEDFLLAEVLGPTRTSATRICDGRQVIANRARGYLKEADTVVNHEPVNTSLLFAAGGLCSTPRAVADWLHALAHGGVVRGVDINQMATSGQLADGSSLSYGYGVFSDSLGAHRRIYHGGDVNGFSGFASVYPDADLVIVAFSNTRGPAAQRLEFEIARRLLEIPPPAPVSADHGHALMGGFERGTLRLEVTLANDAVWLRQGEQQSRLLDMGDGVYSAEGRPELRLTFRFQSGKAQAMVIHQGGQEHVLSRNARR